MRSKLLLFAVCGVLAASVFTEAQQPVATNISAKRAESSYMPAPPVLKALARRIVTQSARVKEGDIVLINGSVRDMELLEDIAVEVQKQGGYPLISVFSERLGRMSYADVPEKYDSKPPKLGMALAKMANVSINVEGVESPDYLADVSPARMAARAKAGESVSAEYRKNGVRFVNVGNDLYPTAWRAKNYEMPIDGFARLFWDGVNIDYSALQTSGEKMRTMLAGKVMEITHPNGTNLKFNIAPTPVFVSDGVITDEDARNGNLNVYLPAGEAVVIPAANSGSGKFVVDLDYVNGKEVRNAVYTFENGKLVSMTGEGEGFAELKKYYDAAGPGKEILGYADIGINPNYVLSPKSKYGNWISAGMVSVGSGGNTWAGGTNTSSGGAGGHLAGATVKVDGRVIVENGVLKP